MTLAIKLAIIAALILSIFIPFWLFSSWRENKENVINEVLHFNAFFLLRDHCDRRSDDVCHRSGTGSTSRF